MQNKRWWICGLGIVAVCAAVQPCAAQIRIQPEAYRIRVVNEMGLPICVKIFAYGRNTYFHADMARGQAVVQDLYAGQRVMCVWDDKTGDLLLLAGVNVDQNGVLRIRPTDLPFGEQVREAPAPPPTPGAPAPAEKPRASPLQAIPRIKIE